LYFATLVGIRYPHHAHSHRSHQAYSKGSSDVLRYVSCSFCTISVATRTSVLLISSVVDVLHLPRQWWRRDRLFDIPRSTRRRCGEGTYPHPRTCQQYSVFHTPGGNVSSRAFCRMAWRAFGILSCCPLCKSAVIHAQQRAR